MDKNTITKISLNGEWEMRYDKNAAYTSQEEPDFTGYIFKNAVPGYWEDMADQFATTLISYQLQTNPNYSLQRYPLVGDIHDMELPNIVGCFFYTRLINLDDYSDAEDIELYFGGVHNTVSAWINGHFLGRHEGYSAPTSFSIPKSALNVGENKVTLAVSNTRLRGYGGRPVSGCSTRASNNYTGGIWGDVEIRVYHNSVKDFWIDPKDDLTSFSVKFDAPLSHSGKLEIKDGSKTVYEAELKAGESAHEISTDGFTLWDTENPKRYTFSFIANSDCITRKLGIRKLTVDGRKLRLNGKYVYLRGICEHGYYPITVHPPKDKSYYRKSILKLKELGFNFIRFHTSIPMPEYIEAADELGMLMELETPNNTSLDEWENVVRFSRQFTAPVMFSSGNEMIIDEDYIEHLRKCSELVHRETSSLFSPMSAMRGIEYFCFGDCEVKEPFPHNPKRLKVISEFCDLYNSYCNGQLSYFSASADPADIDNSYAMYEKPILSHEICIHGSFWDPSLKYRYKNSRIGETRLYSSIEEYLTKKGIIDRAALYYNNSSEWQRRLRKHCFESARRANVISGYDFLGDINHHWHTFGYCVGMMNEFYELKPGETVRNVRRYNSAAVLLCDLPYNVNFECGEKLELPILISNYKKDIKKGWLRISVKCGEAVYLNKQVSVSEIANGELKEIYKLKFTVPKFEKPAALTLSVSFSDGEFEAENEWELYAFPKYSTAITKTELRKNKIRVCENIGEDELIEAMKRGESVVLFGTGPFASYETSFQITVPGGNGGHLATVIEDCALMEDFPGENFCSWQCRSMLDNANSIILDCEGVPFEPLVEAVGNYKFFEKKAFIFEYKIGNGKLIVSSFGLEDSDPGARWLKSHIISYAASENFNPKHTIDYDALRRLCAIKSTEQEENSNYAQNSNDITTRA